MKQILASHAAVVVAMYAPESTSFTQYKSGIYYNSAVATNSTIANCKSVNHGKFEIDFFKFQIS
jgi:hypothetical protein